MTRPRRLDALVAALSLASCTLGPDFTPPTPPEGATASLVSADPALATTGEVPDDWWRLYNDPALDGLLEEAFKANADLKAAEFNLAASRAILEAARVGQYPQTELEAGAVYGRDPTSNEILLYTGRKPFSDWTFDSILDMSYEFDLFGRVRRSIEAAEDSAEASAAARDALRVTVAAETTRAYAEICTFGEELSVARRSVDLVTHQKDITAQRRNAGAGSDFDVVRSEGLVAQVAAGIPQLEGQRRAAVFQLAALLGRTPVQAPTTAESCEAAPHLISLIPVGDGAALIRRRPDVRRADRLLAASIAQIGVATADLYPRISLTGFYGGASDKVDDLATENGLIWGVGPSLSWSFPNLLGPLARIHRAKSGADAALASFDSVVLQALKETEQALSTYRAELDHHTALVTVEAKAQQSFKLATNQFDAGAISNLDLLTAEQTLVSADASLAASDAAIVQDQIAVFKVLGGGWKGPPSTPDATYSR